MVLLGVGGKVNQRSVIWVKTNFENYETNFEVLKATMHC